MTTEEKILEQFTSLEYYGKITENWERGLITFDEMMNVLIEERQREKEVSYLLYLKQRNGKIDGRKLNAYNRKYGYYAPLEA